MTQVGLATGADPAPQEDPTLTAEILEHLDRQIESAHRMMAVVLEQGAAIRERNVSEVVRLATELQTEMHRRESIEVERLRFLQPASLQLGVAAQDITVGMLTGLMEPDAAAVARDRTVQLRNLLLKIQRAHNTNRALMQQELSFLDHLLRLSGSAGGYAAASAPGNVRRRAPLLHRPVFDVEA
ncbi:MAG: flagellar export chaperone FlgN [Solirubrobacteraceae bacterium]